MTDVCETVALVFLNTVAKALFYVPSQNSCWHRSNENWNVCFKCSSDRFISNFWKKKQKNKKEQVFSLVHWIMWHAWHIHSFRKTTKRLLVCVEQAGTLWQPGWCYVLLSYSESSKLSLTVTDLIKFFKFHPKAWKQNLECRVHFGVLHEGQNMFWKSLIIPSSQIDHWGLAEKWLVCLSPIACF